MKKKLISKPTIGADIEVFLKNKRTNKVVSAEGIIKGSKHDPFKFMDGNPYFATSLDNVMAEFCIEPATTKKKFRAGIEVALNYITDSIPKELSIYAFPSAKIDGKYLQTANAQLFGCDPDYNAWLDGVMNAAPAANGSVIRSCGGHIHVGYNKPDEEISMKLIKAMDIFIGLPSVLQEPDNDRKKLYGKAGAFRFKNYGVEYRTVSNYYVNSAELSHWAFDNTLAAINFVNDQNQISKDEANGIQMAINTADKKLAKTMCKYFGVQLAA